MARGMPSMMALLGMLAVAGYQNRDKLQEMLGGSNNTNTANRVPGGASHANQGGLGGMLGNVLGGGSSSAGGGFGGLGGLLGGAGAGGLGSILSGGLGGLQDQFNQAGKGHHVDHWLKDGNDEGPMDRNELAQVLGEDTIATLSQQTGLSREDLLERLSKSLPEAMDKWTPDSRIPTESEAQRFS